MTIVEISTGFGEQLRKLRSEKNMTQEILASHMHVTRQTISGWERGRSEPDIETLIRLADYFNISMDELLAMGGVKMVTTHYRKGGMIMLPFVTIGIIIAFAVNAPWIAMCSIASFGYIPSIILILLGKRTKAPKGRKDI